jgi:hypothetical protein
MRRLILSSTFDFRAFLLGLFNFAAGLGPFLTVVLLRSEDCIAVVDIQQIGWLNRAGFTWMRTFCSASRWPRLFLMTRRSLSSPPPSHLPNIKRPRLDGLTPDDYKNGVMLAPMVRSGARMSLTLNSHTNFITLCAVPTRLFALKHGAKLVWGPEMIDKAMLNAERVVDRACVDLRTSY